MPTRNPRGPQLVPPRNLRKPGDHVMGGGIYPGSRSWASRPENRAQMLPVARNAVIYPGDLVTIRASDISVTGDDPLTDATETSYTAQKEGFAAHPISTNSDRTDTGNGAQWGDVSGGVFQALNYVNNTGLRNGEQDVSVYGKLAMVELYLDDGVKIGDVVGMDFRQGDPQPRDAAGNLGTLPTARTNRYDAVAWNTGFVTDKSATASEDVTDNTLYQRVRAMTATDLAHADRGKAKVGTVISIVPGLASGVDQFNRSRTKVEADINDVGIVQLGVY